MESVTIHCTMQQYQTIYTALRKELAANQQNGSAEVCSLLQDALDAVRKALDKQS